MASPVDNEWTKLLLNIILWDSIGDDSALIQIVP